MNEQEFKLYRMVSQNLQTMLYKFNRVNKEIV